MSRFKYEPLDLEECSFRLIRLLQGESGVIRCTIFDAWIGEPDDTIEYEALSYTWGGTIKPYDIEVNGTMMAVTKNLYSALQHLRHSPQDRVLWVDAICIDQDNDNERSHQVGQMTLIYKRAQKVLIWLGEATTETDIFFHYMQQLSKEAVNHACANWNASDDRWQDLWRTAQQLPSSNQDNPIYHQYHGFRDLLDRSWFKRVWIVQEVVNARRAEIVCGTKSVPARIFAIMPRLVGTTPNSHSQAILDVMPGPTRKHSWWSQNQDLRTLLLKFRSSEASDPRDVIYALLGISSDGYSMDILVPDYKKSVEDIIQDTVDFLLRPYNEGRCVSPLPRWTLLEFLQNLDSLEVAVSLWAARNGNEALVRLLLDTGKVDVNSKDPTRRTLLSSAACNGHDGIVKVLLGKENVDVDWEDRTGQTPLSLAAWNGHGAVTKLLLQSGMMSAERDIQSGWTLLWREALNGQTEIAKLLLDLKEKWNQAPIFDADDTSSIGQYERKPLLWAAKNGHAMSVKLLLESAKVNVNSKDQSGETPLALAVLNGDTAVVKLLLDTNGVDHNLQDVSGQTPLVIAASKGDATVVKLLLDTGKIDVSSNRSGAGKALFVAASNGDATIVKLLLNTGKIDVNSTDHDGKTALCVAASHGDATIVKLLLNTGRVDVNSKDLVGKTPLLSAAVSGPDEMVVKLLLDTGKAYVDISDRSGITPLMWAAHKGQEVIVKLLLNTGKADVNLKDGIGRTPLLWAAQRGHENIVKLLLSTGRVNVDSKDNGSHTPLSRAAWNGHEAVVKLLLKTGKVDVNSRDVDGQTPLSLAVEFGCEEVVKLLLDTLKADVNSKDKRGHTPLSLAERRGHRGILKLVQLHNSPE